MYTYPSDGISCGNQQQLHSFPLRTILPVGLHDSTSPSYTVSNLLLSSLRNTDLAGHWPPRNTCACADPLGTKSEPARLALHRRMIVQMTVSIPERCYVNIDCPKFVTHRHRRGLSHVSVRTTLVIIHTIRILTPGLSSTQ